MDSLGEEEKQFRKEQMKFEGELVVAAYYGRENGEMALELRREGAGIREWEELGRARDRLDIPVLGSEFERKQREDRIMEGVKREDGMYRVRIKLVDCLFGMEREFTSIARSSLFMALNSVGLYPMTYARQHYQHGVSKGEEVIMMWEVLVWIQGVEGAKMVVGRIKNGQAEARDEWLQSLWKEVRDMNRREVEDWVNDKILFMAEWFKREEVLKGEEVDWSKMSKGVPRYIVEQEDAGCLGVDGEGWIVDCVREDMEGEVRE